jgi:polyferredoxin
MTTRRFRRLVQAGFFAYIAYLVIMHLVVGEGAMTSPSPEAVCPFGGVETLWRLLTTNGEVISHTHPSNVVLAAAALLTALLVRNSFCGWICPLGFIQDLVYGLRRWLTRRLPGLRRSLNQLGRQFTPAGRVLDRWLRLVKYGVLVWSVGGAAYFSYMVFRDYDPWAALIGIGEVGFTAGTVVLIILLAASFFVQRPWCRYACPLGALTGLVGKMSPTYIKRDVAACTSCKLCSRACPMGLDVDTPLTIKNQDCNSCLECVEACSREKALSTRIGLPLLGK